LLAKRKGKKKVLPKWSSVPGEPPGLPQSIIAIHPQREKSTASAKEKHLKAQQRKLDTCTTLDLYNSQLPQIGEGAPRELKM
jgi:hypothetical protein